METGSAFKKTVQTFNEYRLASLIIRLLIGVVFIYAGFLKLLDPAAFAWNIYQYGLMPRDLINVTAISLPAIEILAGVGFIFNVRGSMAVIAGLLVMFLFVLGYALLKGLNVDCGCFSAGEPGPEGLWKAIVRDMTMMVGTWYLYRFREERNKE
jgi:uncharacterized membrane protein YphA (DoxX/SURF4 family)